MSVVAAPQNKLSFKLHCCDCDLVFANGAVTRQHIAQTNHMSDKCCTLCGQLFGTVEALKQHSESSKHKLAQAKAQVSPSPPVLVAPSTIIVSTAPARRNVPASNGLGTAKDAPKASPPAKNNGKKSEKKQGWNAAGKGKGKGKATAPKCEITLPIRPATGESSSTPAKANKDSYAGIASKVAAGVMDKRNKAKNQGANRYSKAGSSRSSPAKQPKAVRDDARPDEIVKRYLGPLADNECTRRSNFEVRDPVPAPVDSSNSPSSSTQPPAQPPTFPLLSDAQVRQVIYALQLLCHDEQRVVFPWVSGPQVRQVLYALQSLCHDEERLIEEMFYTGNQTGPKPYYNVNNFLPAPIPVKGTTKRSAIAIDCEMVGLVNRQSEIVRLCAVDVISGETLIDSLVEPLEKVHDWRTEFSGVTPGIMHTAMLQGKTLEGWEAARAKIFEFADRDTVLVGHSLNHDLRVLRIAHDRVFDTSLVTAEAAFGRDAKLKRKWGLKQLSKDMLGVAIQASSGGHDSVEDTLATRELALWCIKRPEELAEWARGARAAYEEGLEAHGRKGRGKGKGRPRRRRKMTTTRMWPMRNQS